MKLTPYLIAINLGLVAIISLSVYNHAQTKSLDDIDLPQNDSEATSIAPTQSAEARGAKTQEQKLHPKGLAENTENFCDTSCQTGIIERLAAGHKLSNSDALLITNNADTFAPLLAANPNALGALLQKLQQDEDQTDGNAVQLAAFTINAALTGKSRLAASQKLLSHKDPIFRIAGITLAANDTGLDPESARAFKILAAAETNPRVLTALINAMPKQTTAEAYNPDTIDALDSLMTYDNSDFIRGSALIAKSRLVPSTSDTKLDIKQALQDPSNKIQVYGLRAYSIIKTRQTQDGTETWGDDQELHNLLTRIVDDPDISKDHRDAAQNLIWDF